MTRRIFIVLGLLAAHPAAALADPGHLADHGHGHTHWLALFIFGGFAVSLLAYLAVRAFRRAKRERGEARP